MSIWRPNSRVVCSTAASRNDWLNSMRSVSNNANKNVDAGLQKRTHNFFSVGSFESMKHTHDRFTDPDDPLPSREQKINNNKRIHRFRLLINCWCLLKCFCRKSFISWNCFAVVCKNPITCSLPLSCCYAQIINGDYFIVAFYCHSIRFLFLYWNCADFTVNDGWTNVSLLTGNDINTHRHW